MIGLFLKMNNLYFKAAVLYKKKRIRIVNLRFPKLKEGQVLIKNHFSGICHTQLLEYEGKRGEDKFLPHCLGHEASSTVHEVGPLITKVKKNDRVVASWIKGEGIDTGGATYEDLDGNLINSGPISVFSEFSVVSENRLYKIPKKLSPLEAVFYGCAIPTGMGSIKNFLNENENESICIIGCGGIGSFATIAASLLKCKDVTVIDTNIKKLNIPKKLGFKTILLSSETKQKMFYEENKNKFNLVIESTGNIKVMSSAISIAKPKVGTLVINGNADFGKQMTIDPIQFNMGKKIVGSWGGNSLLDKDIKYYFNLSSSLKINISKEFNSFYKLDNIDKAFNDLKTGKVLRPIIKLDF